MNAVVVHEHGGYDALRFEEVADPVPAGGEVLIEIRATGINHLDLWARRGVPGYRFPLPLIPGSDVSGVVRDYGAEVRDLDKGAEVVLAPGVSCGLCRSCQSGRDHYCRDYGILGETRNGGYAQLIAVSRSNVLPKPKNLSFEEAASVPLTFLTAWHMLIGRAGLKQNETVLVHAAGSGVSAASIQIAKLWGATVIATASTEEKLKRARDLGADHVINYSAVDFSDEVRSITGKRGADVVVDHVGDSTWEGSMRCLAWQGRIVTCGATTGPLVKLNLRHVYFKSLSILGSTMGSRGELFEILDLVEKGSLVPMVDKVMPLANADQAHELLEKRQIFGKIVLTP